MIAIPRKSKKKLFRVYPLGAGNYFSELRSTISFILQAEKRVILVEAPAEPLKKLRDCRDAALAGCSHNGQSAAGLKRFRVDNINDLVVSHHHGDHSAGLETIAYYKMFVQGSRSVDAVRAKRKPKVYGTEEVLEMLKKKLGAVLPLEGNFPSYDLFFDFVLLEPGYPRKIGAVEIDVIKTEHCVPSFAMLFRYDGRSVSYSGDTRFRRDIADFLAQADVMIHECDGDNRVHTTPEELSDWVNESGYDGRLFACHMDDRTDLEEYGLTPLDAYKFIDI